MPDTPRNAPKITLQSLMGSTAAANPAPEPDAPTPAASNAEATRAALSAEDQAKVDGLARQIDFTQSGIEQTWGADAQRDMAAFSDRMLQQTTSKDAGHAGELLRELLATVDNSSLSGVKKVPIIGSIAVKIDQVRREYQKVVPQVDEIVGQLEGARAQMIGDIALYDELYDQSVAQYKQLKIHVAAGAQALADFRTTQLPALEAEAAASNDPMAGQVLKDFKSKLDRFEKHLDDLDRISVVALQACPQIKILQNADATIADKIQTTVSTTIPLWKSQMVIALGLENQRKALDLQQKVDDVTNRLLRENADQLHQGAVAAERANQRGAVDVDTLQHVNDELIATLKDTIEVQKQGRAQRAEAQQKMRTMEGELKAALIEHIRA